MFRVSILIALLSLISVSAFAQQADTTTAAAKQKVDTTAAATKQKADTTAAAAKHVGWSRWPGPSG